MDLLHSHARMAATAKRTRGGLLFSWSPSRSSERKSRQKQCFCRDGMQHPTLALTPLA